MKLGALGVKTDDISQLVWFTCLIWRAWTHRRCWGWKKKKSSLKLTEINLLNLRNPRGAPLGDEAPAIFYQLDLLWLQAASPLGFICHKARPNMSTQVAHKKTGFTSSMEGKILWSGFSFRWGRKQCCHVSQIGLNHTQKITLKQQKWWKGWNFCHINLNANCRNSKNPTIDPTLTKCLKFKIKEVKMETCMCLRGGELY